MRRLSSSLSPDGSSPSPQGSSPSPLQPSASPSPYKRTRVPVLKNMDLSPTRVHCQTRVLHHWFLAGQIHYFLHDISASLMHCMDGHKTKVTRPRPRCYIFKTETQTCAPRRRRRRRHFCHAAAADCKGSARRRRRRRHFSRPARRRRRTGLHAGRSFPRQRCLSVCPSVRHTGEL